MGEYGWAFIPGSLKPGGPTGSVQLKKETAAFTGSAALKFTDDVLNLTGTLNVSGTINANELNIDVVNRTVINLSASGDTVFGNSQDDAHQFSGSLFVSGNNDAADVHQVTGSFLLTSSANPLRIQGLRTGTGHSFGHYLALNSANQVVLTSAAPQADDGLITQYTNPGANRVITSIDASGINAEANFTFNGTNLDVVGSVTSSVSVSSSAGEFHNLTGSYITGSGIETTTLTARNIGGTLTTPSQLNITAVGTLTSLTCSGDLQVDGEVFNVNATSNKVGVGRIHAQKKLEVLDTNEQLRLSYSREVFGISSNVFSDVYTTTDGYLILTASSERVGIGTTTPRRMLDVDGHMRVSGNLEVSGTLHAKVSEFIVTANNITFGDDASDTLTFNAASGTTPNGLNLDSNTWVLDSANNKVGIGAAHPSYVLDVESTVASAFRVKGITNGVDVNCGIENTGTESDDGTLLAISAQAGAGDPTLRFAIPATETWSLGIDNSDNDKFKISQNSTLHTDTRLTIAGGSVGIGITAPQAKLHVEGDIIIAEDLAVTGSITGSILTDGTAKMTGGNISDVGTLTATSVDATITKAAQPNITSVGNLTSLTVDTNVLVVDATTNRVGIGVTDPARKLEVLDTAAQLRLTYQRAAGFGTPLITSDIKTTSAGHLILSGSGGRVGIGTDTPSRMLDVDGHMRVSGNLEVTGSLHAKVSEFIVSADNITFGADAADTLIFNAATGTVMNGLNWDNNTWVMDSDQNRIGIGVEHPVTKLHVLSSAQTLLKLSYDGSNDADFSVSSAGDLTIKPSGDYLTASSGLNVSGSVFLGTDLEHDTVVSGELTASVAISSSLGMFTGLTSSVVTDGSATMVGGNISNVGTLTATNIAGTITTATQAGILTVGTLTGLTASGDINFNNSFYVPVATARVGIGRSDPTRPLEVLNTSPQLKLSYSKYQLGVSENVFSEIYTNANGHLILTASSERVGIGTATPTSTLALSGTLNVSSSGNPVKFLGLLTGSLAGPGSYLGIDTTGQIVLTSSAGGSGGGGSTTVNGPVSANDVLVEGYNYFTTISSPTIVSLPSASIGDVVHVKAGPGVSATNYIRISGSQSGDTIDGVNHVHMESPYGALAFIYVASNKDWRIL